MTVAREKDARDIEQQDNSSRLFEKAGSFPTWAMGSLPSCPLRFHVFCGFHACPGVSARLTEATGEVDLLSFDSRDLVNMLEAFLRDYIIPPLEQCCRIIN
jgi:hypothetical protein